MTKDEVFRKKQTDMSDDLLIDLCSSAISKMCRTGGRSFTMSVPAQVDDTDMILSELVRRFKKVSQKIEKIKPMLDEAENLIKKL